jgi:tetratricopeptide (TPR) repeat protein
MPTTTTAYRVFIASPGGLQEERKIFREAIEGYNQAEAVPRGVLFVPVGWEDTLGGVGRPQSLINDDVRKCDFLVLVLWDRWGTPPDNGGGFSSGTEEEFHIALECLEDEAFPMTQIVVFFKSVEPKQLADPGPQLLKVLDFRQALEQNRRHLFHTFDSTIKFEKLLTRHLAHWTRVHEKHADLGMPMAEPEAMIPLMEPVSTSSSIEVASAWAWVRSGRRTLAESLFAKAIVEGNNPRSFLEFGRFLLDDGRNAQADVMFNKAYALAEECGDKSLMADTLRSIAQNKATNRWFSAAEEAYGLALDLDRSLGRTEAIASDLMGLAALRWAGGDLVGAEEVSREAIKIHENSKNVEGFTEGYRQLARILTARGNLVEAETLFSKSLELCRQFSLTRQLVDTLAEYGYLFEHRGELTRAEALYSESLQIAEDLSIPIVTAYGYLDLARVLAARKNYSDAENLYSRALVIFERLGWFSEAARCSRALGLVLRETGNLSAAEARHLQALEYVVGHNLEEVAVTYLNLTAIAKDQNDSTRAREYREEALKTIQRLGEFPSKQTIRNRADRLTNTLPE